MYLTLYSNPMDYFIQIPCKFSLRILGGLYSTFSGRYLTKSNPGLHIASRFSGQATRKPKHQIGGYPFSPTDLLAWNQTVLLHYQVDSWPTDCPRKHPRSFRIFSQKLSKCLKIFCSIQNHINCLWWRLKLISSFSLYIFKFYFIKTKIITLTPICAILCLLSIYVSQNFC